MPRLSLYKPTKTNDYHYMDRNIREQFSIGGTGVHVDLWGASKGAAMWGAGGKGKPPKAIQAAWAGRMPTTTAKA